jgi:3-oxoacyl-[acyl-carrier protein] reductase
LEDGFSVTLVARQPEKLERAAAQLRAIGDVHAFAADLRDEAQVEAAAMSHRARYGRLDVLVNNAGVGIAERIDAVTAKRVDLQLNVDLRGYILCIAALSDLLLQSAPSAILNVSSFAGVHGQANMSVYSATKAGVIGLTQAIQAELGPAGVRATAICPAFVDTPMVEWLDETIPRSTMITVAVSPCGTGPAPRR